MLTSRYMTSVKNVPAIMQGIVNGTAPSKFTQAHLKSIGFKSSNDFGIISLLKDLGFLTADGAPTPRYHEYRDRSRSRAVLGAALREAYEDLFHINERPSEPDRSAIEGKFKSVHNATDRVAKEQTKTFFAFLELADLADGNATPKPPSPDKPKREETPAADELPAKHKSVAGLHYNIQIHLPATKDPEVYNAIFKSLREHILDT